MIPGCSDVAFGDWQAGQLDEFQNGIEHIAMDAFAGFKKAATDVPRGATTVMDAFHVTALVETKFGEARGRLQTEPH